MALRSTHQQSFRVKRRLSDDVKNLGPIKCERMRSIQESMQWRTDVRKFLSTLPRDPAFAHSFRSVTIQHYDFIDVLHAMSGEVYTDLYSLLRGYLLLAFRIKPTHFSTTPQDQRWLREWI